MNVSAYDPMNTSHMSTPRHLGVARPQVGIERLPTKRANNEPREAMNCKSCRKRKIKCNRLRPSCEACQVFQCPCLYDAVPKKRGPKTDVLEALLRRVDGLEAKLREKNDAAVSPTVLSNSDEVAADALLGDDEFTEPAAEERASDGRTSPASVGTTAYSPCTPINSEFIPNAAQARLLLDRYFTSFHGKPFYILDEASIRQRFQMNQLPNYLSLAISAVAVRYKQGLEAGQAASFLSDEYADLSRSEVDIFTPSIDALQALLLLVEAYLASGKSRKSYMLMTNATGMAMALGLHREMLPQAQSTPVERETRRRLFWSCYMLDRFLNTGSNRPCMISDGFIVLKFPSWSPTSTSLPLEGEFFQSKPILQASSGSCQTRRGSSRSLIDVIRILGIANEYLTASTIAEDSHFSWLSSQGLSNVRQELDLWAPSADGVFASPNILFAKPDAMILMLSNFIYHLVHILIYRPFLPLNLMELAGDGHHHDSWQFEATNTCFHHANAIAELLGVYENRNSTVQWPEFVAYCIFTAGTIHVHGVHFATEDRNASSAYCRAADCLSAEMRQLKVMSTRWACVEHQLETLQEIYSAHSELVKTPIANSLHFASGYQTQDFFGRYTNFNRTRGQSIKLKVENLSLHDHGLDSGADSRAIKQPKTGQTQQETTRPNLKRKNTAPSSLRRPDSTTYTAVEMLPTPTHHTPGYPRRSFSFTTDMITHSSPGLLGTPTSLTPHVEGQEEEHNFAGSQGHMSEGKLNKDGVVLSSAAGFGLRVNTRQISGLSGASFTPPYSYISSTSSMINGTFMVPSVDGNYDTSYGTIPTNAFNSPTTWYGKDEQSTLPSHHTPSTAVSSPSTRSNNESLGNAQDDGKDAFLSLLDHLSENGQGSQIHASGNELDFFN